MNTKQRYEAAELIISAHGDDAALYAAMRADAFRYDGDQDEALRWSDFAMAIDHLQRRRPRRGELIH